MRWPLYFLSVMLVWMMSLLTFAIWEAHAGRIALEEGTAALRASDAKIDCVAASI